MTAGTVTSPNRTDTAESRLLPVIVTSVPPVAGPVDGVTDVTVGSSPKLSSMTEPQVVRLTVVELL